MKMLLFFTFFFFVSNCISQTIDREDEFKEKNCLQITKVDIKINVISGKARIVWNKYGEIVYKHETYKNDVSKTYPGLYCFYADYETKAETDLAISELKLEKETETPD